MRRCLSDSLKFDSRARELVFLNKNYLNSLSEEMLCRKKIKGRYEIRSNVNLICKRFNFSLKRENTNRAISNFS